MCPSCRVCCSPVPFVQREPGVKKTAPSGAQLNRQPSAPGVGERFARWYTLLLPLGTAKVDFKDHDFPLHSNFETTFSFFLPLFQLKVAYSDLMKVEYQMYSWPLDTPFRVM